MHIEKCEKHTDIFMTKRVEIDGVARIQRAWKETTYQRLIIATIALRNEIGKNTSRMNKEGTPQYETNQWNPLGNTYLE